MGVYKYNGKKGVSYFIDFYFEGKRIREPAGPNKKDAQEKLGEKLKEIREGRYRGSDPPPPPDKVRFTGLIDQYEQFLKTKKSYKARKHYLTKIRTFFGDKLLEEITALDVARFQAELKAKPTRYKRARGTADVNRHMADLRAMLNKAVDWEIIPRNPADKVEDFPEPAGRNSYLTTDQAKALLKACHSHLKPIVLCAIETGMRKSEVLGLRWREIRDGQIYLSGERTKNGKPREVPISGPLLAELEKIRKENSAEKVVSADDVVFKIKKVRKALVHGKVRVIVGPMKSVASAWTEAKKRAGIDPSFRFHDLRHTTASWLKMAGVDDYTVMEILGHSDHTMMKRYAHLSPEHKKTAINTLPDWSEEKDGQNLVRNPEEGKTEKLVSSGAEGGI